MIWAAISYFGKSKLTIIPLEQSFDGPYYARVLRRCLLPLINDLTGGEEGIHFTLVQVSFACRSLAPCSSNSLGCGCIHFTVHLQDKSSVHRSRPVLDWLAEHNIGWADDWPGYSPDLNLIENVWGWLTHSLEYTKFDTLEELKQRVQELWDSIDDAFLHPYYESLPKRYELVLANHGEMTRY
jgi:DDE superfamily endonuclease